MKPFANVVTRKRSTLSALALVATFSAGPAWTETTSPVYTMAVVENSTLARAVLSGHYRQAIDKVADRSRSVATSFVEQNSLCVAYAKSGDLDKAIAACENAVTLSREAIEKSRNRRMPKADQRSHRRDLAIALSNRGVLRAAIGEMALAEFDFVEAGELDSKLPEARTNLERLSRASGSRV